MEQKYPGITGSISAAVRNVVTQVIADSLPGLRKQIEQLVADNFDAVEQRETYDFLASPAGRKMVAMGDKIYNQDKLRAGMAKLPPEQRKLTGEALAAAIDPDFVTLLTPDELAAVNAFAASAGGSKMAATTPQLQTLIATWANTTLAGHGDEIRAATIQQIDTFIAKSGKPL